MKLVIFAQSFAAIVAYSMVQTASPIHIGSRLELMVDEHLIERMSGGAKLHIHRPTIREVVIVTDEPWEGNACPYRSVFQDGDLYRMYYGGYQYDVGEKTMSYPHPRFLCYAESKDGIHWTKPNLGLVEFKGSKKNNIILSDDSVEAVEIDAVHVAVLKDENPDCNPDARYKALAVGRNSQGLFALKSPDGIHFSLMSDKPIITKGAFDSQNLAFWDSVRGEYREYHRGFRDGVRDILTAMSKDFLNWTEPVWLNYPGAPKEHLYTNQIKPYYRAPHIFIGFPMRYQDRGWSESMRALPGLELRERRSRISQRYGTAITDGLFMTSRDGVNFKRWGEAFIRPGLRLKDNWVYGDNCTAWGIVETKSAIDDAPNELSIYATESYWTGNSLSVRRFTLRIDGFVSVWGPLSGGEFVTKPLVFEGSKLVMNFSTSAAGSIQVEIQDVGGKPFDGFALPDCPEIFGDAIERAVIWKDGSDVSKLAGKPIRLRFLIKDADLYSIHFK